MAKAFIRAMLVPGFPGIYRAGRLWPGGATVEVEVVPGKKDPEAVEGEVLKICEASLAAIRADGRLSVLETAEAPDDLKPLLIKACAERDALQAKVEELEKMVADQRETIEALTVTAPKPEAPKAKGK